jgi:hypothetical protein
MVFTCWMTASISSCESTRAPKNSAQANQCSRWIGRDTVPALLGDVFGVEDRSQLKQGKGSLPTIDNDFSERVRAGKSTFPPCLLDQRSDFASCREIEGPQVQGRWKHHAAISVHHQGRWRPKPEALGSDTSCRRPSGPGREHCPMDKQAQGEGTSRLSASSSLQALTQ